MVQLLMVDRCNINATTLRKLSFKSCGEASLAAL